MSRLIKRKNGIWRLLFILVWCMQMLAAVYFCCQKQGFHEDEYYTYYSTARTYGLNIEDNAWMEKDEYFNEFVVLEGERFRYGLVKQVQSWDVHPPVYYWLFHTIASLFPGEFSKWYGLSLNLAAFGISMFLLWLLSLKLTRNNEKLSLLICFFYGFTPAVISSVVFIRMYALLTVFVLLCAVLHIKAMEEFSVTKFLMPVAIVTYLGFLTQYYYFIFLFFMAAAFCVYLLWKDRNLWNCIRYAVSLAIAFILAYLTYPSCLGQMFKGQRGAQATGNFFDLSNTFMRLDFFYRLLDEYVFGKMLPVLLVLGIVLALRIHVKKNMDKLKKVNERYSANRADEICNIDKKGILDDEKQINKSDALNGAYFVLLAAAAGYFFTVSKTALLLGETSIRYQLPIYGMVVMLLFTAIYEVGCRCYIYSAAKHITGENHVIDENHTTNKKYTAGEKYISGKLYNVMLMLAAVILAIINLSGLMSGRVVFLYPEDEARIAFARERSMHNTPVVCIYDEGQSWCVWDCADEFFEYDRIYFASQGSDELITDSIIAGSGELVVYLSKTADAKEQLGRIMGSNPKLTDFELRYGEKYCDVYYLY